MRGCDDTLTTTVWDGSWSPFASLGGCLMLTPAVASWGSGRLDVFFRGCTGGLWQKWWSGGQWNGPANLDGGCLASGPGAEALGYHQLDVFVRGCDTPPALWWDYCDGARWWWAYRASWP